MSLPLILRRIAQREFDDAVDWYEKRSPGRGTLFKSAVRDLLSRISIDPLFYSEAQDGIREALLHKYPYCIYYRVESDKIIVLSVFHTSRDPTIWQERQ